MKRREAKCTDTPKCPSMRAALLVRRGGTGRQWRCWKCCTGSENGEFTLYLIPLHFNLVMHK